MPTAFGQAMLDTINGVPQSFRMNMLHGPSIIMHCQDFIQLRTEEKNLLDSIQLPDGGNVLDWGCGIGRHLAYIRSRCPSVNCIGIDICESMLEHCRQTISPPANFYPSHDNLDDRKYDLIMLMGNNLGVFGNEQESETALRLLIESLNLNGKILIETGNPFGNGYFSSNFTIDYREHHDGPFTWGYSDRHWISRQLQMNNCHVDIMPSNAPGGIFFFAIGCRNQ